MYKFDFPIFKNNPKLVYLDSAASSQKPQCVIDAMSHYISHSYSPIHRGIYDIAELSSNLYEDTRKKVASLIGAQSSEIAFTSGTTESINAIAEGYFANVLREGDEIILTQMEHHANILPWQRLAKRLNLTLKYIRLTTHLRLDVDHLQSLITPNTRLISLAHISNVLGIENDIASICSIAHRSGIRVLVDGAQAVGHMPINVHELGCDFYVFSGHKMLAPTGVGVIFARLALHKDFAPFRLGGGIIEYVSEQEAKFLPYPQMMEAGSPNIIGIVGISSAIDYITTISTENIRSHERHLSELLLRELRNIPELNVINFIKEKGEIVMENADSGIVSFYSDKVHSHDLASYLNGDNICVRAGHHCAQPLMDCLRVPSTIRVSFGIYNSESDIDSLVKSIKNALEFFK